MLGKFKFDWFFLWVNDSEKNINKSDLLGVVVEYVVVQNLCVVFC